MGQTTAAMSAPAEPLATRRKRLLWRANHRGIKEMDLLLGGFVCARIDAMTEAQLDALETIVDVPDRQLLAWATRQEALPDGPPLLLEMLSHRP